MRSWFIVQFLGETAANHSVPRRHVHDDRAREPGPRNVSAVVATATLTLPDEEPAAIVMTEPLSRVTVTGDCAALVRLAV